MPDSIPSDASRAATSHAPRPGSRPTPASEEARTRPSAATAVDHSLAEHIAGLIRTFTPDVGRQVLAEFVKVRAAAYRAAAAHVDAAADTTAAAAALARLAADADAEEVGARTAMPPEEYLGVLRIVHAETLRRNEALKASQTRLGVLLAPYAGASPGSLASDLWEALYPARDLAVVPWSLPEEGDAAENGRLREEVVSRRLEAQVSLDREASLLAEIEALKSALASSGEVRSLSA